jgi:hypothetical protein
MGNAPTTNAPGIIQALRREGCAASPGGVIRCMPKNMRIIESYVQKKAKAAVLEIEDAATGKIERSDATIRLGLEVAKRIVADDSKGRAIFGSYHAATGVALLYVANCDECVIFHF